MAEIDNEDILTVFAEKVESPLYSWEVAEELPVDTDVVESELVDMTEQGLLESDDDYAPGTVYRLATDVDAEENVETDTEAQATATSSGTLPRDQETTESPPAEPGEESVNPPYQLPTDAIQTFDPPGMPEQKDRRREALRHAYGYLREQAGADQGEGPANGERRSREQGVSRQAFVEDVYPEYRGAYEEPDDGWWEEVIRPGLLSLPGVEQAEAADTLVFVGTGDREKQS